MMPLHGAWRIRLRNESPCCADTAPPHTHTHTSLSSQYSAVINDQQRIRVQMSSSRMQDWERVGGGGMGRADEREQHLKPAPPIC